jgi:hypothetical protein
VQSPTAAMLVYDALTGETRRVRRSAICTWTEKEDRTLRDRRPSEPWSETLAALGGRHTQQECRRRLRFLQRQAAPPTTPPPPPPTTTSGEEAAAVEPEELTAEEAASAPLLLADPAALAMAGPQAAALYWTERMLAEPAALKTCYASYQALAFLAVIVSRGGAAAAAELYVGWTEGVRACLRRAAPAPVAAAALRQLDEHAPR